MAAVISYASQKIGNFFVPQGFVANNKTSPDIALMADGEFIVTYNSTIADSSGAGIGASTFDKNGNFISEYPALNGATLNDQYESQVVAFGDGRVAVVYTDRTIPGTWDVRARMINGDGTLGQDFQVANAQTFQPDVAILSNGNIAVTYAHDIFNGDTFVQRNIEGKILSLDGPSVVGSFTSLAIAGEFGWQPQIVALKGPDGGFAITYESFGPNWNGLDLTTSYGDIYAGSIYTDIFNSSGSLISHATNFRGDGFYSGTDENHWPNIESGIQPTITALSNGNVAILYLRHLEIGPGYNSLSDARNRDEVFTEVFLDIVTPSGVAAHVRVAGLDRQITYESNNSTVGHILKQPSISELANGFIAVSYNYDSSVITYVYDSQGNALSGIEPIILTNNGEDSSTAALHDGRYVIGFEGSNPAGKFISGEVRELVRTIDGDSDSETLTGDALPDHINGNLGHDSIIGYGAADILNGGPGNDYLNGGDDGDSLYGEAGSDTLDGGDGIDYLAGGAGTDSMYAGAGNDVMQGGDDADYLDGNAGADTMYGDGGNDVLDGGADLSADADYMDGGDGHDTLYGRGGNDTMIGGVGFDALYGDAGADYLFGGDGNDYLGGGDGGDFMQAGNGDDSMDGGGTADYMEGEAGADSMYGGDGNDVMHGGNDADYLNGQNGADTIYGEGGNDVLDGGSDSASDYLDGGAGSDAYIFGAGMGNDVVGSFDDGPGGADQDLIYIDHNIVANFATLSPAMSQNGSNVIINLGGFGGIQINGVTLGNLGADDFVFY